MLLDKRKEVRGKGRGYEGGRVISKIYTLNCPLKKCETRDKVELRE